MIRLPRKLFIAIIHLLAHCFRLEIAWLCLKDGKVKSGDLWVEYEGKRPVRMSFERLEQQQRFKAALKGAMNAPHKPLEEKPKARSHKKADMAKAPTGQFSEEEMQQRFEAALKLFT